MHSRRFSKGIRAWGFGFWQLCLIKHLGSKWFFMHECYFIWGWGTAGPTTTEWVCARACFSTFSGQNMPRPENNRTFSLQSGSTVHFLNWRSETTSVIIGLNWAHFPFNFCFSHLNIGSCCKHVSSLLTIYILLTYLLLISLSLSDTYNKYGA